MFEITVYCEGHEPFEAKLVPGVYRVGASPACHLQISGSGVAPRHCQLTVGDHSIRVQAFDAANPVYVDGAAVGGEPMEAGPGSEIRLGDVVIKLIGPEGAGMNTAIDLPKEEPPKEETRPEPPRETKPEPPPARTMENLLKTEQTAGGIAVLRISGVPFDKRLLLQEIKKRAHVELIKRLNLKRLAMSGVSEDDLNDKAKSVIHEIVSEISIPLPPEITHELIEQELVHEAIGLGPLEVLIAMPEISEIMVNGHDKIYVEYKGKLHRTDLAFADNNQVIAAIERIVSPLGRRIDESSPMVDARLKDGSRVNAIIPPLALGGPSITIRKFSKTPLQVKDLIRFGSISQQIADFLDICVKLRKNIVISGGTGSGKTTLLNILSGFLPDTERILTIEDAAELQLRQEHVVRLEARPANIEGKGEVTIRDLVKNALRMRPDRIVIGECRGGEALDMLQAMNTGHDGSLTTIHANSPRDCLSRLETLVLMAGFDLPLRAIREQIASAITLIVQITREKDGSRKVVRVSEITKMEGEIITMQDIFVFHQDGWTEDGKIRGRYVPTGSIPTFMDDIRRAGLALDISMFTPPKDLKGGNL
jgi:pilus assembly protein CpaF